MAQLPDTDGLLSHDDVITFAELCQACNVDAAWLEELVAHGALAEPAPAIFSALSIVRVRRAKRLQRDFDLNPAGAALVLDLLDEIERLHRQLKMHAGAVADDS